MAGAGVEAAKACMAPAGFSLFADYFLHLQQGRYAGPVGSAHTPKPVRCDAWQTACSSVRIDLIRPKQQDHQENRFSYPPARPCRATMVSR